MANGLACVFLTFLVQQDCQNSSSFQVCLQGTEWMFRFVSQLESWCCPASFLWKSSNRGEKLRFSWKCQFLNTTLKKDFTWVWFLSIAKIRTALFLSASVLRPVSLTTWSWNWKLVLQELTFWSIDFKIGLMEALGILSKTGVLPFRVFR